MAKWEDRDPRWLVQNRDDGKNVNGWHWEERNVLAWSTQQLEELLTSVGGGEGGGPAIRKLKSCTGEATITTRKGGKRLAIWDLNLSLEWVHDSSGKEIKGAIEVREVSSAHDDPDDVLFEFTVEGSGSEHDAAKKAAAALKPAILEALAAFGQRLHGLE